MKKLYLFKNPELFQGEKYLKTNKNYFEGWYFKNINDKNAISFIPGISINRNERKAFIQVITNDNSYFIDYDIEEFTYNSNPFYIKIGNNYFSKDNISIDIKDDNQNLIIYGNLKYCNSKNINTSIFRPNIMGPFSYIPFMECNHAIISMKNNINGFIKINDNKICFNNGTGYIEKDWGISFPKTYIWCQGNNFKNSDASFMLSIANIPFKIFSFRGLICSLIIDNKEYRFATYNNTKLLKYKIDNNLVNIKLKKKKYLLDIKIVNSNNSKLIAPIKGKMDKEILESISSVITVTLRKDNNVIYNDTSINCGLEIVC
jgi:hypothetical protein